jgi:hypothetical protein
MEDFRNKKKSHLVTTNLLARGMKFLGLSIRNFKNLI